MVDGPGPATGGVGSGSEKRLSGLKLMAKPRISARLGRKDGIEASTTSNADC